MKRLFVHLCLGLILLSGVIYVSLQGLEKLTLHGDTILVPNLSSYSIYEVEDTLSSLKLRFSVVDSGAYNASFPRGSVIGQLPKALSRVKNNREILLTVNPKNVSLISVPDYTDRSTRQYISELKAKGFRVGKFIYKKDAHANVVLGVRIGDRLLTIDEKLEKSSKLDLVLGNGKGVQMIMPKLIGYSKRNIESKLQNLSLNIGEFYYDNSVVDTLNSFVYKQRPKPEAEEIDLGSFVKLWFTEDSSSLAVDTLELMRVDSLKARLDSILNN
ncbi:MAG: PASTA domain-containing protein [Flavobacteriales bacterium]|jgi:beta-lactam-binding protein with PASTA domain|tara:strand:- start:8335 stop:9150 length:816 start_codon:yes stop_codon:yes gene_type:complete